MNWRPKQILTEAEVQAGMRRVIGDGLATEAMTTLTGGTFLVAMALLLGASNFQIGLLAALPTFTNLFQLLSIWLVRRFNNRRAISVTCSFLARTPLIIIGSIALLGGQLSINFIIFFLFFYYLFGSIAGPSWNAWMKDLIPENKLGAYFSRRGSYTQMLNVLLGLSVALLVDYIKKTNPQNELHTYALLFITGGIIGIIGAFILSGTPEPVSRLTQENIFKLLRRPLHDSNFRRLLLFNSVWSFALNIATPFFTVFMMKGLGLSISYIIGFGITSQLCSIATIRFWGAFADRYSNKTIIAIGAPLYILCLIAWCFVGIYTNQYSNLLLLLVIHIFMGIANAGINLSLTNISLKLSPSAEAIVYLSAKNIIVAFFSSMAPLLGGYLADYFSHRSLEVDVQWKGPHLTKLLHLISLHGFNFLFLIGALVALLAVEFLLAVKETGEVEKDIVVRMMRSRLRSSFKDYFIIGQLISWHDHLRDLIRKKTS